MSLIVADDLVKHDIIEVSDGLENLSNEQLQELVRAQRAQFGDREEVAPARIKNEGEPRPDIPRRGGEVVDLTLD